MSEWVKIDNFVKEIEEEPWSLYWKEWKSGTTEFNDFLFNPIVHLSATLKGVGPDWGISTEILNHEVSLLSNAVCNTCMVMYEEKRIKLTFFKHKPE